MHLVHSDREEEKVRRLKPTKLPPNPTFLDRLEHGLQWVISWLVIDIPGRPCISGLLTSLLMFVPIFGIATVIGLVLGALLKLHLSEPIHLTDLMPLMTGGLDYESRNIRSLLVDRAARKQIEMGVLRTEMR